MKKWKKLAFSTMDAWTDERDDYKGLNGHLVALLERSLRVNEAWRRELEAITLELRSKSERRS